MESRNEFGLISIIIPVYNASAYIEQMLDDIFSQTYSQFEVIAAYDIKSQDSTLEILQRYSQLYGLTIDMGNDTSVGAARNRGITCAKGDYIIFLDADDRIIPSFLSDLMKVYVMYPDLDVVFCEYAVAKKTEVNEVCLQAETSSDSISVISNTEILKQWCLGEISGFSWRWMVKREYFTEYNVQYPNYSRMEDDSYILQLITNTKRIGHTEKQGYIYIQHPGSLSHNLPPLFQRIKDYKRRNADISRILMQKYPEYWGQFRKNMVKTIGKKIKEYVLRIDTSESLKN